MIGPLRLLVCRLRTFLVLVQPLERTAGNKSRVYNEFPTTSGNDRLLAGALLPLANRHPTARFRAPRRLSAFVT